MELQQVIQNLDKFKDYLLSDFSKDLQQVVTMGMASDIVKRVRDKGLLSDGTKRQYSAWWKEEREKKGRQTAFKNYSFDTPPIMWPGFGVKEAKGNKAILGGRTPESQRLINENSRIDKTNIIAPVQSEVDRAAKMLTEIIAKKLNAML